MPSGETNSESLLNQMRVEVSGSEAASNDLTKSDDIQKNLRTLEICWEEIGTRLFRLLIMNETSDYKD